MTRHHRHHHHATHDYSKLALFLLVGWAGVLTTFYFLGPVLVLLTAALLAVLIKQINLLTKGSIKMALVITDSQKVTFTIKPLTAAGNPASLDGAPVWSVADPTVLTLTVAEDGLSATVAAAGLGSSQVSVTADADLDAGEVKEIAGVQEVLVVAGEAATLGLIAGEPTDK